MDKEFAESLRVGMLVEHRKSGGIYTILMFGFLEKDETPVVIYQAHKEPTGKVWVRPYAEFCDGRFRWF